MPDSANQPVVSPRRYFGLVRATLLLAGAAVFCYGVYFGATIPEPPPNSDGVPTGFAVIYVLIVQSVGALIAQVGYAFPAGTGRFRFGPLADRPVVVRAGTATAAFVGLFALVMVFWMLIPDSLSLPGIVTGTNTFLWFGAVAGTTVGVVLTAVLTVGTAVWRLARGEPVFGNSTDA